MRQPALLYSKCREVGLVRRLSTGSAQIVLTAHYRTFQLLVLLDNDALCARPSALSMISGQCFALTLSLCGNTCYTCRSFTPPSPFHPPPRASIPLYLPPRASIPYSPLPLLRRFRAHILTFGALSVGSGTLRATTSARNVYHVATELAGLSTVGRQITTAGRSAFNAQAIQINTGPALQPYRDADASPNLP